MPQNLHINGPYSTVEQDYYLGSFIIQPTEGVYVPMESKLRGLITYPSENQISGKLPLVILAHGRHSAAVENFRGLSYLAHHLSSYGYICASIDLNDLVGPQGTRVSKKPPIVVGGAIFHRAKTILRTIVSLREHTVVGQRANFKNVGLIGHSRGAEAVARAGAMSEESGNVFGINAVLSIAPVDFSGVHIRLPFFLLYGSLDADVSDGQSFRVWDRASSNKHGFYVDGAIHNYFSSNWENEWSSPNNRIISRETHEDLAKTCSLSFFHYYLQSKEEFRDILTGHNLPNEFGELEISRLYSSVNQQKVDNFEGVFDSSTNSIGRPVVFEGAGEMAELDLERFKVDAEGFSNEISTYYKYHEYLGNPQYAQYFEYIRNELARMSQGFVSVMRYFYNASQSQTQIDFANLVGQTSPEFEATTNGWVLLESELRQSSLEGLLEIQKYIERNSSALHGLNHVGKGLLINWNGTDAKYQTTLDKTDISSYFWLSIRVGQLYNSDKNPLLNPLEQKQSFTIHLMDDNGSSASVVIDQIDSAINYPKLDQNYFKANLSTLLLPISSFLEQTPNLNLKKISELVLSFDQVESGSLVIDDIAFSN